MLFVVSAVLFDMLKARQLACVSKSGQKCPAALSLSSWRAWIEISCWRWMASCASRSLSSWRAWIEILLRTPLHHCTLASLSSWRAWIEMVTVRGLSLGCGGRSPHGERGLKSRDQGALRHQPGRSPHGERGLKYANTGI